MPKKKKEFRWSPEQPCIVCGRMIPEPLLCCSSACRETGEKMKKGLHAHLAYFGSELACPVCNPICHKNHGMGKSGFCGHIKCPMNPKAKSEKRSGDS